MNVLRRYCKKIAQFSRIRYEIYISEVDDFVEITEKIDEIIRFLFSAMAKEFGLTSPETHEVFSRFFWQTLEETGEWRNAVDLFGKDFEHTKDMLKEYLESV